MVVLETNDVIHNLKNTSSRVAAANRLVTALPLGKK